MRWIVETALLDGPGGRIANGLQDDPSQASLGQPGRDLGIICIERINDVTCSSQQGINQTRRLAMKPRSNGRSSTTRILQVACIGCASLLVWCQYRASLLVTDTGSHRSLWSVTSTLLAQEQSLGFFDDILDDAWNTMKVKAASIKQYYNTALPETGFRIPAMWYARNLQPILSCPQGQLVGGLEEGAKWVCDPMRLAKKKTCLVYSISESGKHTFEEGLADLLDNKCEIHVFGVSSNNVQKFSAVDKNIYYHAMKIKGRSSNGNQIKSTFPTVSLAEAIVELAHQDRVIDILNIDCDKCEW
jgi:Methyltransferase domain